MATDNITAINKYLNNIGNILRLKNNIIDPNSPFSFLDIPDKDIGLNLNPFYANYFIQRLEKPHNFNEENLFKYILFKNMHNLQNLTSIYQMYYYRFIIKVYLVSINKFL